MVTSSLIEKKKRTKQKKFLGCAKYKSWVGEGKYRGVVEIPREWGKD